MIKCWLVAAVAILWPGGAQAESYNQKVRCLSEAVYREARGESYLGKLAVAQTVINRSKNKSFPKGICKTVFQRGQFSWTKNWNKSWNADFEATQVARVALMGTHSLKSFQGLYFHSTSINPGWKRKKLATIGNHVFYS